MALSFSKSASLLPGKNDFLRKSPSHYKKIRLQTDHLNKIILNTLILYCTLLKFSLNFSVDIIGKES